MSVYLWLTLSKTFTWETWTANRHLFMKDKAPECAALMAFGRNLYDSWCRHQMETFSALLAFVWGIRWSPANSPHKGQWRRALMFSLICAWINDWINNREAGDLKRRRANNDVIVMYVTETSGCLPFWYSHVKAVQLNTEIVEICFRISTIFGMYLIWYIVYSNK